MWKCRIEISAFVLPSFCPIENLLHFLVPTYYIFCSQRYLAASPCFMFLMNLIVLSSTLCFTLNHLRLSSTILISVYLSHCNVVLFALFCKYCVLAKRRLLPYVLIVSQSEKYPIDFPI